MFSSNSKVSIKFKTAVITAAGERVRESPWQRNLILDQGLDRANATQWCDLFNVACAGTGALTVKRDSGAISFTRSAVTVTANIAFFQPSDVGRLLKLDSGAEMYIVGYTSPTIVTVGTSGTLAASPGTIWYVNETGLVNEVKRTQTYSLAPGANNTIVTLDTLLYKRTFVFSAEVAPVAYEEIGWSWTMTPGAGNVFGMAPMMASAITVGVGESLEVIVQMSMVISPATITPVGDVSGGAWNTAGTQMMESLGSSISRVDTSGNTTGGDALEPSYPLSIRLVQGTWTQSPDMITAALGWPVTTLQLPASFSPYVTGSFERISTRIFSPPTGNGTVYGLGFDSGTGARYMTVKFTTPQTKLSDSNLTISYKKTWDRALDNASET